METEVICSQQPGFSLGTCFKNRLYFLPDKAITGKEVDFIVPIRDGTRMLVQVCESLAEPQTRKWETAALSEAMAELGFTSGTIVTRNNEERIDTGQGAISVVPIWCFLLDLPESAE